MRKRLSVFDLMNGFRAIAASLVLLAHTRNFFFVGYDASLSVIWKVVYLVTGLGHEAVMIFFVLSGFWITKAVVQRAAAPQFPYIEYAVDRISRLWLVLVPALVIGGALDVVGRFALHAPIYLGVLPDTNIRGDVASSLTPLAFAGNLTFLQTLLVPAFGSNGALWSLANEFWYYVWFPPIYLAIAKRRVPLLWVGIALLTMAAFSALLVGFLCWLFGSAVYFLTQGPSAVFKQTVHSHLVSTVMVCGGALVFVLTLGLSRTHVFVGPVVDLQLSAGFAAFLVALICADVKMPGWLARLCDYGGDSSYSLYAVHVPLVAFAAACSAFGQRYQPQTAIGAMLLALCVAIVAYAYLFSKFTEANTGPVRRWVKDKLGVGRPVTANVPSSLELPGNAEVRSDGLAKR